MTKAQSSHAVAPPLVSPAEVRRFDKAVTVRDKSAFLLELDLLVREKLAAATNTPPADNALAESLRRKAAGLRAPEAWQPSASDIQRGRAELIREFERPHNLPLADFAHLAHKSRQQIYKDIAARRLLALDIGRRGQRLPDWQLEPPALRLTQAVLGAAPDVDAWTVYRALANPSAALGGKSAVASVTAVKRDNVDDIARRVLSALGIQEAERAGATA